MARAVAWRSDRGDLVIEIRGPLREEVLDALARELAWLLYTLSKEGLNWEVIDTLRRIEELLCG